MCIWWRRKKQLLVFPFWLRISEITLMCQVNLLPFLPHSFPSKDPVLKPYPHGVGLGVRCWGPSRASVQEGGLVWAVRANASQGECPLQGDTPMSEQDKESICVACLPRTGCWNLRRMGGRPPWRGWETWQREWELRQVDTASPGGGQPGEGCQGPSGLMASSHSERWPSEGCQGPASWGGSGLGSRASYRGG